MSPATVMRVLTGEVVETAEIEDAAAVESGKAGAPRRAARAKAMSADQKRAPQRKRPRPTGTKAMKRAYSENNSSSNRSFRLPRQEANDPVRQEAKGTKRTQARVLTG